MKAVVSSLSPGSLDGTDLRRDLPPDFFEDAQDLITHYDFTTVWYDAFWTGRRLVLVSPTLFNLEHWIAEGMLVADGKAIRPNRVLKRRAHDEIVFDLPRKPARLELRVRSESIGIPVVNDTETEVFAGLNTLVTLQKDNPLEWIRDFLLYHRRAHGLEAALLFDNGSSRYGTDDILNAASDAGLGVAMVIEAPFRFGTRGKNAQGRRDWRGLSLQAALLNIARLRFLGKAMAVLQCDIDELVWCRNDASIFDLTRRSPLGYVHFNTFWRHAPVEAGGTPTHADHIWMRRTPERSQPKWCIRPNGPLFWAAWDVHKLHRLGMRQWQMSRKASGWHLRQLSTHWKVGGERMAVPPDLVQDSEMIRQFRRIGFADRNRAS